MGGKALPAVGPIARVSDLGATAAAGTGAEGNAPATGLGMAEAREPEAGVVMAAGRRPALGSALR
jgi:hypothetical protein